MPGPEVAVIITNHNYGRFLADAVASASSDRQRVRTQIVVVDDGSDDCSSQVLNSMEPDVEVIRQGNLGQGAAMNTGFGACRAPIVIFLDADDMLLEGTAAAVVGAFARHPRAARVHFGLRCIDAEGQPIGRRRLPELGRSLPDGDLRALVLSTPDDIAWQPTSGNAFAAETLRRILPMPEAPYRIGADHYLSNLSALLGEVRDLGRDGGNYRIHGGNADHRDRADLLRTRGVIERTIVTHRHLHALAGQLHFHFPEDPLAVASVTFVASRLFSLRADPGGHPVPGDQRLRLATAGMRACLERRDLTPARRFAGVLWFSAMAISPRRLVTPLARRLLTR